MPDQISFYFRSESKWRYRWSGLSAAEWRPSARHLKAEFFRGAFEIIRIMCLPAGERMSWFIKEHNFSIIAMKNYVSDFPRTARNFIEMKAIRWYCHRWVRNRFTSTLHTLLLLSTLCVPSSSSSKWSRCNDVSQALNTSFYSAACLTNPSWSYIHLLDSGWITWCSYTFPGKTVVGKEERKASPPVPSKFPNKLRWLSFLHMDK